MKNTRSDTSGLNMRVDLSLLVLLVILKAEHLNQRDVCVVQISLTSYSHCTWTKLEQI